MFQWFSDWQSRLWGLWLRWMQHQRLFNYIYPWRSSAFQIQFKKWNLNLALNGTEMYGHNFVECTFMLTWSNLLYSSILEGKSDSEGSLTTALGYSYFWPRRHSYFLILQTMWLPGCSAVYVMVADGENSSHIFWILKFKERAAIIVK